jgi:hypothetical protein
VAFRAEGETVLLRHLQVLEDPLAPGKVVTQVEVEVLAESEEEHQSETEGEGPKPGIGDGR